MYGYLYIQKKIKLSKKLKQKIIKDFKELVGI